MQNLLHRLIQKYGYEIKQIFPVQKGYRNQSFRIHTTSGEELNLIIYKNEAQILQRIRSAHKVANFLYERDFPVRVPLGAIIKLSSKNKETIRYACLYNYLPGKTIPWEGYTQKHVKLLGKTLSDMHANWADFPNPAVLENSRTELLALNSRMHKYFQKQSVQRAMQEKLSVEIDHQIFKSSSILFRRLVKLPGQMPLHLDFVRSNVLFDYDSNQELHISGIIDFEKVAKGPVIIDIARTLAFLIVDCKYKPQTKIRKYFLHSGYQKRGQNPLPELNFLPHLLRFFWLHDFYKFLLHNPYESLAQNEHYIRTKELLLEEGVLR